MGSRCRRWPPAASWPRIARRSATAVSATAGVLALLGLIVVGEGFVVLALGHPLTSAERPVIRWCAVALALSAVMFSPVRRWAVELGRAFVPGPDHRQRRLLESFAQVSRSDPLDEQLLQLAEALHGAFECSDVAVWTGGEGMLARTVAVPEEPVRTLAVDAASLSAVVKAGAAGQAWARTWLPGLLDDGPERPVRVVPAIHAGDLLGVIVLGRGPAAEDFTAADSDALVDLARQVGSVLHTTRLDTALRSTLEELRRHADELQASRARIVAAADASRQAIERDLHDGAQQRLVAISVGLGLAEERAEVDPASTRVMLGELRRDLQAAVQQLRELARGIYPPLLFEKGLVIALKAVARRNPMLVRVDAEAVVRYDQAIEAAAYFCCVEAIQNATKHAGPTASVAVRIWGDASSLRFSVSDDGVGFASPAPKGAGFANMADRIGALGGTLTVTSTPGSGTAVAGCLGITGSPDR